MTYDRSFRDSSNSKKQSCHPKIHQLNFRGPCLNITTTSNPPPVSFLSRVTVFQGLPNTGFTRSVGQAVLIPFARISGTRALLVAAYVRFPSHRIAGNPNKKTTQLPASTDGAVHFGSTEHVQGTPGYGLGISW